MPGWPECAGAKLERDRPDSNIIAAISRFPDAVPDSPEGLTGTPPRDSPLRRRISNIGCRDNGEEYADALQASADRGIVGGGIYDAMLAHCALKAEAETIYSWNARHYAQCGPEVTKRPCLPFPGPNPYAIAAAAGHGSITMTYRYVHPQKQEIWAAFEAKGGTKIRNAKRRKAMRVVVGKKENEQ